MKHTLEGTADKSFKLYYSVQDNRCGPAKVDFQHQLAKIICYCWIVTFPDTKMFRFSTITFNLIQPAVLSSLAESEDNVSAVHEEPFSCPQAESLSPGSWSMGSRPRAGPGQEAKHISKPVPSQYGPTISPPLRKAGPHHHAPLCRLPVGLLLGCNSPSWYSDHLPTSGQLVWPATPEMNSIHNCMNVLLPEYIMRQEHTHTHTSGKCV